MGGIDKFLQFLGGTETTRWCEERTDVIAEGAIVRMFLNSHHLNAVVSILDYTRQHVVLKLGIGAHLLSILSHTHVALVDEQRVLLGFEIFLLELVGLLRIPHLSGEYLRIVVLYHATAPSGNTLTFSPIPLDLHLIELAVLKSLFRKLQFPVACAFDALATVFVGFLPVVEVAYQIDVGGIGSPLTEHPALSELVQAEIQMTGGEVRQFLLAVLCQLVDFPYSMIVTASDSTFEGFQP